MLKIFRFMKKRDLGYALLCLILVAGLLGLVAPGAAAFLHNFSTIALSVYNMTPLVPEEE